MGRLIVIGHRSISRHQLAFCLLVSATAAVGSSVAWAARSEQPIVYIPQPITLEPEAKSATVRSPAAARRDAGTPEDQVARIINLIRYGSGEPGSLPPLKRSSLLDAAAAGHSAAMSEDDFFAHCNPISKTTPPIRVAATGYTADVLGESLGAGYVDASELVAALTASPDNATNLQWYEYREVGVGYVNDGYDLATVARDPDGDCYAESAGWGPYYSYWTLVFGRRDNVYPVIIDREAPQTPDRFVDLYLYGEGWASNMRLSNDGGTWTDWLTFSSELEWELEPGEGIREVYVEIKNAVGEIRTASDTIYSVDGVAEIFSDGFEDGDLNAWSAVLDGSTSR